MALKIEALSIAVNRFRKKNKQKNTQNTNKDCDVEHLNRASGIMRVFYAK